MIVSHVKVGFVGVTPGVGTKKEHAMDLPNQRPFPSTKEGQQCVSDSLGVKIIKITSENVHK